MHRALHMVMRYDLHSQYVFMPCCVATVLLRLNMQLPCSNDVDDSIVMLLPAENEIGKFVRSDTKHKFRQDRLALTQRIAVRRTATICRTRAATHRLIQIVNHMQFIWILHTLAV